MVTVSSSRRRSGSLVAVAVTRPVLMFMRGHDPARTKQCNCRNHHQQPASTFIVQGPSLIFDDIILASHQHRARRSSALLATGLMTCISPATLTQDMTLQRVRPVAVAGWGPADILVIVVLVVLVVMFPAPLPDPWLCPAPVGGRLPWTQDSNIRSETLTPP